MFQRRFYSSCALLLCLLAQSAAAQKMPLTPYEKSGGRESATYEELIAYYRKLDQAHTTLRMEEAGPTDTRYPLHVVYYSSDGRFDTAEWKRRGKLILLINNGIHPGEPDGMDASLMLLRDVAEGKVQVPENLVLAVVPVFNIGGALNRGSYSRANQSGPQAYGFRGSARNLDLNRDFIKADAQETRSLIALFHRLDPELFIDNHVSNGADYQHVMSLLSTQHNKLGGIMGRYLNEVLEPAVYASMKEKGYDLLPYVNVFQGTPEKGWTQFLEPPRFASGFAALFQTYAFVPESHMLKPFRQRVEATYELMKTFIAVAARQKEALQQSRRQERERIAAQTLFPLSWKPDTTQQQEILFKGYEAGYKPSAVSGQPRLYYDRNRPFERKIPFRNTYVPAAEATIPAAYVVPQGWLPVLERLRLNGVEMRQLERDTLLTLTVYRIEDYKTVPVAYEGHYPHRDVQVRAGREQLRLLKGDWIIPTAQRARRYLAETLEPRATDAFFVWNFFDAVLQQKEYFSDYVFEDEAAALLKDTALRAQLEAKKKADTAFARDGEAQLEWVYRHSPYYEPVHLRYPVFRLE